MNAKGLVALTIASESCLWHSFLFCGMHVYHVYTIRLMSAYTARNILLIWPTRAHKHRGQTQVEPCRNIVWNACFDCAPFGSLFELHCNVQRLLTLMREVYSRFLQLFTLGIMECGSQHKVVVMWQDWQSWTKGMYLDSQSSLGSNVWSGPDSPKDSKHRSVTCFRVSGSSTDRPGSSLERNLLETIRWQMGSSL